MHPNREFFALPPIVPIVGSDCVKIPAQITNFPRILSNAAEVFFWRPNLKRGCWFLCLLGSQKQSK